VVVGGTEVLRGSPELNRSLIQLHASLVARINEGNIMIAAILLNCGKYKYFRIIVTSRNDFMKLEYFCLRTIFRFHVAIVAFDFNTDVECH
jgi:hypothetical protein